MSVLSLAASGNFKSHRLIPELLQRFEVAEVNKAFYLALERSAPEDILISIASQEAFKGNVAVCNIYLLSQCARKDYPNLLKVLLGREDVDVNVTDNLSQAAIHYAVQYEGNNGLEYLIKDDRVNLNLLGSKGLTPLMMAMEARNNLAIELLCNQDSRINVNILNSKGLSALNFVIDLHKSYHIIMKTLSSILKRSDLNEIVVKKYFKCLFKMSGDALVHLRSVLGPRAQVIPMDVSQEFLQSLLKTVSSWNHIGWMIEVFRYF